VAPIHADEGNRAVAGLSCGITQTVLEEVSEGGARHLADAHCEFAMANATEAADMAFDLHVIGRIGEDQVDLRLSKKALVILAGARIAA
jgi:selenophosphate synthase